MDRKLIPLLTVAILLLLAVALLLPGGREADPTPKLPWDIQITPEGQSQVFGMTLGVTSLTEARQILNAEGELTLFRSPEGGYAAEAYFQRASLSGLRADFVIALALDDDSAEAMFQRGLRLSTLGSGVQKVSLSQADLQQLADTPIAHLTYIPSANLEAALIQRQFGEPELTANEGEHITHWLYPRRGLDIAINDEGKEVLQYLNPAQFHSVLAPLGIKTSN